VASVKPASGEDSLIARYFRPIATDPGAFGLDDDAAAFMLDRGLRGILDRPVEPGDDMCWVDRPS